MRRRIAFQSQRAAPREESTRGVRTRLSLASDQPVHVFFADFHVCKLAASPSRAICPFGQSPETPAFLFFLTIRWKQAVAAIAGRGRILSEAIMPNRCSRAVALAPASRAEEGSGQAASQNS